MDELSNDLKGFDDTSNIWLRPFSAVINCLFPVEYVYADWIGWQTKTEAERADPESLIGLPDTAIEAGSRAEGFCIPQFILRKSDIERGSVLDIKEHWRPDCDMMTASDPFEINDEKKPIPIFTVEHVEDDPKYAKLRLTKEWKVHRPRYKNVSCLHHTFLLPSADHPMDGREITRFDGQKATWSYSLHGPVRKLQSGVLPSYEEDQTGVFKYPIAWPEPAKEWLVRPRPSGWPSSDLVQEILNSGCHLAPVGRGTRFEEPVDLLSYCQNPELSVASSVSQSTLARILCRLWFLHCDICNNEQKAESENEFKLFVKEEVNDLSLDEDFLALALVFFHRARNGVEPSLALPNTRVMELLREEQMNVAKENVEEAEQLLKGTLYGCLKRSDLSNIENKMSTRLQEEKGFTSITKDEIMKMLCEELEALVEERMKEQN